MRTTLLIILLLLPVISFAESSKNSLYKGKDETYSEYKNGRYFHTYSVYLVNAPFESSEKVLNELFDGMKTAPTTKLEWAFSGLGDVGAKEDMLLYETGVSYNPVNAEYLLNLQIIVKNNKEMPVEVLGQLKNEIDSLSGEKMLSLCLSKKIKVLHDGQITITAIPHTKDTSLLVFHSQLRFGWFFDLFFTQKRYRNIMEWRFAGFLKNVKNRIETQPKESSGKNPKPVYSKSF